MSGFESFTLEHYAAVFEDTRLIVILINTIVIALLSALVSTTIGVLGALAIVFIRNKKMRNAVLSLNNILIVSPDVIIGASFLILFTMVGVKLGFASVLNFTYRFQYSDCCYYGVAKITRNESFTYRCSSRSRGIETRCINAGHYSLYQTGNIRRFFPCPDVFS